MNDQLFTDAELTDLLKANDEKAFREIYTRYWEAVFLAAYRKVRSKQLAEEFTQNIFASLWKNRRTADIRVLRSYLFNALKYAILNHVKSQLVRDAYLEHKQHTTALSGSEADRRVMLHELSAAIEKGVAMLPGKTQTVFRLSRIEYRSVKEISLLLKMSEKAVEYHITRSLKTLRCYLKDHMLLISLILYKIF